MKTAQAIFGALAAALGLAAVVTFYDDFMRGTQMPPHPNEAPEKGDLLTPASSIAHDFAALPTCGSGFHRATFHGSESKTSALHFVGIGVLRGSTQSLWHNNSR
jgi:hypothetical protein